MWLFKSEEEADSAYGKSPEERGVAEQIRNSVVIVDKHAGPTSQQITVWAKEIFSINLAGHTGTLDPNVTGVLPIALENAVKAMPALMGLDKEYVGVMHTHKDVGETLLRDAMLRFIGRITQVPPVKSAVSRRPRQREIYFFDFLEMDGRDVLFKVGCQAGTYIRKLCSDLGNYLGTGAHLSELRRIRVGNFTEEQAHSLLKIKDAYDFWKEGDETMLREVLIPVEHAVSHLKKVFARDSAVGNIAYGSPLYASGVTRIEDGIGKGDMVGVFSAKGELISIGFAEMTSKEMLSAARGMAVRTDRVFIGRGTYPKSGPVHV